MKTLLSFHWFCASPRWISAVVCFVPSLLLAHPGHSHPDETDEFDFLQTTFFHSHGAWDLGIAAVAMISLTVVCLHRKPAVRISGLATALGAIALLPIL